MIRRFTKKQGGGSTSIGTSQRAAHYYKYPSLTFQFDGSYYDRYGGFYVAYWSEPTEFSGSSSYVAYYNYKQSHSQEFFYRKVPLPFLSTTFSIKKVITFSSVFDVQHSSVSFKN
ncbi:hypothetical protein CHS0354_037828 [Potamilus streckersoni]|uniref:Uncharacterized protein n=1 Tax=Potamilus streckersoni TaxID=2493646 RepID=A0AAE0SIU0_9BIVA|nr:hypothetical protein CHS0354_037828 [Potamilus streckersoni]